MDALSSYMLGQFTKRMARHLRDRFPGRCGEMSEQQMLDAVRRGINDAAGYGVTAEPDVQRYLEYMLLLSPDFDVSPETAWAGGTLRDSSLSGTAKMNRIDRYYIFASRE
jgi:hypothetical protein